MRLIGLDPGLRNTGWGVVDVEGNRLTYVADGTVSPNANQDLARRLRDLHEGLAQVLGEFNPDEAAVEETFVNKNPGTTLRLGEARGVVVLAPALAGLPVAEYSANRIKKSIVGAGHAANGMDKGVMSANGNPAMNVDLCTANMPNGYSRGVAHVETDVDHAPTTGTTSGRGSVKLDIPESF